MVFAVCEVNVDYATVFGKHSVVVVVVGLVLLLTTDYYLYVEY